MHRFELVDLLFGFGRQIVVGAVHVDVLRITAVGRERNREQRGRQSASCVQNLTERRHSSLARETMIANGV